MNLPLGFLIELTAFAAAAYVVIEVRPRVGAINGDLLLGTIGLVIGAGALLFQVDVSPAAWVGAPLFAALLVVAHVHALEAAGVTLPAWVNIPPLRRRPTYARAPMSQTVEEPMQPPDAVTTPEPVPGLDEPLPGEDELAPPLGPLEPSPDPAWPTTIVRPRVATRLPRRGARRTRVEIRRLGPFSVLKFSLIFYFCVFLVVYLALAMIWAILSASGAIHALEQLLGDVFPSGSGISPTNQVSTKGSPPLEINTGQVFTWLFVVGCVGVVVWSLINVFVAVIYNLISDIVGGVEVTLADRRD